ncbi:3-hydroxyacyl-CoA dehydrogenase NAD-binding domain-containing protein [Thetidibacter halocola]|uniref:Enoyl-CoA hydratase/isomerase family protein n=1 Tax=Thetidibacter halocola TaxID=2827239 RepID=A0A8J8B8T6_9RHOB|nr:3-hydroxyacyl-CoA dehydrogenase NAD-binding domain-containing protein [Thetidibacter halocola]MBS0124860.1 enoyl-CoA hydratase/isomerase family protein [Thetidibacter halocola]
MQLSETVSLDHEGDIALIRIDNPPVNAAGVTVRQGLVAAVDWLAAHPQVEAAALYAAGRTFVAGADIREFGKPPLDPWLPEVCQRLEDSATPIVCILHGTTLGGGLEIAMGCHARLALPGAKVGLPEVHLGIIPGAGGTQRMPRLTGQAFAVEAITTGRHIALEEALSAGIIDGMATDTPDQAARNAARAVLDGALRTRATGAQAVTADPDALDAARARIRKTQPHLYSPLRCVDAVELSTLPIREGIARERVIYQECHDTPQRAGLIHAFFAERAVAKVPEAGIPPRATDHIGVIGAGTMGAGIATACLLAGLTVTLTDRDDAAIARGRAAIDANLDGAVKRGKLADKDDALARLATTTDSAALSKVDILIEAAFEDMAVKQAIFADLDRIAKPGAVLATNTSYLDVNTIAQATARPGDVMGLHFFSPAHVMRLCEVVVAEATTPETAATGFALAKRLRKIAVRSGVCDGFIGNRILRSTRRAAEYMMLDGAPFAQIDAALEAAGWAMGPFRVSDLAGLDIAWAQRKRLAATRPPEERYVDMPDRLCEAGHLGRKTGAGYYLKDGTPNPAALSALEAERAAKGIAPRTFTDDEIVSRFLTAMIMEASRIFEERIALRPIDVDAVLLFGYGFPRHLGGPLHQADAIGAAPLVDRIDSFAQEDRHFWQVPEILRDMAHSSGTFAQRN